jgi:hypothetical protein
MDGTLTLFRRPSQRSMHCRAASPPMTDKPLPYDGPVCARIGCGRPIVRRVLPNGKLESSADFRRRTCCSPECRRKVQHTGLGFSSRGSR